MTDQLAQRLATLEAQRVSDFHTVKELKNDVHAIGNDVREIKNTVVRSHGFLAGAAFVVATIWTLVLGVGIYLWERLGS